MASFAVNERNAWEALIEHTSSSVCHTCYRAYRGTRTDPEYMAAMCPDGRAIRQAWLDAFAAYGHKSG